MPTLFEFSFYLPLYTISFSLITIDFNQMKETATEVSDSSVKGQTIIFIGGITIFGTCRQFFSEKNAFQTTFSISFCNENNFYDHFKKTYMPFYRCLRPQI